MLSMDVTINNLDSPLVSMPFISNSNIILILIRTLFTHINKHLLTGPKGNSEFCFPETLNIVPRGEAEGNIEGRGETKLTVSRGTSH